MSAQPGGGPAGTPTIRSPSGPVERASAAIGVPRVPPRLARRYRPSGRDGTPAAGRRHALSLCRKKDEAMRADRGRTIIAAVVSFAALLTAACAKPAAIAPQPTEVYV